MGRKRKGTPFPSKLGEYIDKCELNYDEIATAMGYASKTTICRAVNDPSRSKKITYMLIAGIVGMPEEEADEEWTSYKLDKTVGQLTFSRKMDALVSELYYHPDLSFTSKGDVIRKAIYVYTYLMKKRHNEKLDILGVPEDEQNPAQDLSKLFDV